MGNDFSLPEKENSSARNPRDVKLRLPDSINSTEKKVHYTIRRFYKVDSDEDIPENVWNNHINLYGIYDTIFVKMCDEKNENFPLRFLVFPKPQNLRIGELAVFGDSSVHFSIQVGDTLLNFFGARFFHLFYLYYSHKIMLKICAVL